MLVVSILIENHCSFWYVWSVIKSEIVILLCLLLLASLLLLLFFLISLRIECDLIVIYLRATERGSFI